jgi:hypothetical protein
MLARLGPSRLPDERILGSASDRNRHRCRLRCRANLQLELPSAVQLPLRAELATLLVVPCEAVKDSLRQLSKGAGKDLAEMAEELLAGRTTVREIGQSEAYATHLNTAMAKCQQ